MIRHKREFLGRLRVRKHVWMSVKRSKTFTRNIY